MVLAPHPKVLVYDDLIEHSEKQYYIATLLGGTFFMNSYGEGDDNFPPLSNYISGKQWLEGYDKSYLKVENETMARVKKITSLFNEIATEAKIKLGEIDNCTTYALTVADKLQLNCGANKSVLLYMANDAWKDSWGGELQISEGDTIVCTVPFIPGRVIHLNGELKCRTIGPCAKSPKFMVFATLVYSKYESTVHDDSSVRPAKLYL